MTTTAPSATRNLNRARTGGVGLFIVYSPWSIRHVGWVFLEGGRHSAGSGHYRFHTKRVYLPRRPVPMKKSLTSERVKLAKLEPAALLHSLRTTA